MTLSMYREEELIDGLVVDSEGYICGYVAGFTVKPDRITINLYDYETKKVKTINEGELTQRLLAYIQKKKKDKKALFPIRRRSDLRDLHDLVRKRLNLPDKEPVNLELLVKYAKAEDVEVPFITQEVKLKVKKGSIEWSEVDKIAFSDLGRCILLSEAVEANRRGIPPSDKVGYKSTEELAGKVVIDTEARIVGSAVKFLVGDPPGILINVERLIRLERPDPEGLKKILIPSRFVNLKQLFNQVERDLGLKKASDADLLIWAKRKKIEVPLKVLERREVAMELPISWAEIAKIGDVVILKKNIEALIEEVNRAR